MKQGSCNLFADDSVIYTTGETVNEVTQSLQSNLNDVGIWYEANKLVINADKCKSMLVSGARKINEKLNVYLNERLIEQVNEIRYLGIKVDDKLSWYKHIEKLHVQVMGKLSILRRLSKFLPKQMLEKIFKTTILPCIDYADTVWGTCSEKGMKMAQRLQNFAARIITGNYDYINFRGEDLVRQLKWQTIKERRIFHTAILMFKCTRGLAPNYLCDQINLLRDINVYETRYSSNYNVHVPFPRKEIFKRSFLYDGAKIFNSLPDFIKESNDICEFKSRYRAFYFT